MQTWHSQTHLQMFKKLAPRQKGRLHKTYVLFHVFLMVSSCFSLFLCFFFLLDTDRNVKNFTRKQNEFQPLLRKKRLNSDNLSVTSFDTGSEVSLPMDSSRSMSEDRISTSSLPKSGRLPSPKVRLLANSWTENEKNTSDRAGNELISHGSRRIPKSADKLQFGSLMKSLIPA